MNLTLKLKEENLAAISLLLSVLLHIGIFAAAVYIANFSFGQSETRGGYVQVSTNIVQNETAITAAPEQPAADQTEPTIQKEKAEEEKPQQEKPIEKQLTKRAAASPFLGFSNENADTTGLNNVYKESTLDVTIKYPAGWTYIDQNVKNKLDGVTFIAAGFNPPPYVHLAVMDRALFNESRYQFKIRTSMYTAYYNDPEEMAGQVSQTFYIRTETDEDYSIKFIINGRDAFKALQPTFFGMIKSFKFKGWSLF